MYLQKYKLLTVYCWFQIASCRFSNRNTYIKKYIFIDVCIYGNKEMYIYKYMYLRKYIFL